MRKALGILCALVLVAGTAWWLRPAPAGAGQPGIEQGATASPDAGFGVADIAAEKPALRAATATDPGSSRPVVLPDSLPALPPVDAPLADSLPILLARAAAGDASAACHLFVATERCRALQQTTAMAQMMESSLVDGTFDAGETVGVQMIASMESSGQGQGALCTGLDVDALPAVDALPEQALRNLSPRQKTLVAMLRRDGSLVRVVREPGGINGFSFNADYLVPQFLADNDMAFLQAGVDAADPLALEGMLLVHAPGGMIGGPPFSGMRQVRPDPYRFARFAMLGRDLFGAEWLGDPATRTLDQVLARMPPGDRARLDAEVAGDVVRWRAAEQSHGASPTPEGHADPLELCRA